MSNQAQDERLKAALEAAKQQYVQHNRTSEAFHKEAIEALPGGNTRTVLHTDPFPLYMKSGLGCQVTSEDGDTYTDFTGEFTAALYGHSNPKLVGAIQYAMNEVGMNLGATIKQEHLFAQELCKRFDLQKVRFANSGTEANLHALAAAKLFTGKRKLVAFGGGYHGGVLGFPGGKPGANTVDIDDWIVVKYNDLDAARTAIRSEGVAAVIIEGMQGAGGCITASPEFLRGVQQAASEAGVLFIIDEVMTSRISTNGLAHMYGLKPDLKTFGKWLGGGLAFGAFGGRTDIMAAFDPRLRGCLSHSGTFNNNTLVTHAGYKGLAEVYTANKAGEFTKLGDELRERLNQATQGTKLCFTGLGTVMTAHFPKDGARTIRCAEDVEEIQDLKDLFWFEMLNAGFWIARRGFIALILVTPAQEIDRFVAAVENFVRKHREIISVS